jgi:hypothetical protein
MVQRLKKLEITIRQFQDFTPTPGTISTAMYVSKIHPDTGKPIEVADNPRERKVQRSLIEKAFFQDNTQQKKIAGNKRHTRFVKNRRR